MPLGNIIRSLENGALDSPAAMVALIEDAVFDEAWIQAHLPDPLPRETYSREVLYSGQRFEIVLATWPAGISTLVHNHGAEESHGLVVVLCGEIFNHIYRRGIDGQVHLERQETYRPGDAIAVPKGLLHSMGNARGEGHAASLHIYAPKIADVSYWDPATLQPLANTRQVGVGIKIQVENHELEPATGS